MGPKPIVAVLLLAGCLHADWLVDPVRQRTTITADATGIVMTNGIVRRAWRVAPNAATVAFENLESRESFVRSVKPEAEVEIDGNVYAVGGLTGQVEHAYLKPEWLPAMGSDPRAFQYRRMRTGDPGPRFAWKRKSYSGNQPWPPPGAALTLYFEHPNLPGVSVEVHYEMYDGAPVVSKWITVNNATARPVKLTRFSSEILGVVEPESIVEDPAEWRRSNLQVETDYSFIATHARPDVNLAARWEPDPDYKTQVNYRRNTPALLRCMPPQGPAAVIEPGGSFTSFRAFELLHDSWDRERRGLAQRRMYRLLAPWALENPILMHVRKADPASVKLAIDQCADVGFEMVILTFGSGFNIENEDPAYLAEVRSLVDYAHAKGIELGGYSLLASRKISPEDDVINPKTGATGGAIFENSPCLGSRWGLDYFRKLRNFIEATGLGVLEHDGSYPGDLCASTKHPGHAGLADSQWKQWKMISDFYAWARARGVYLNVPDWYFLEGANKTAMGYREDNWSLPRERQIILARQNLYDGTWDKAPSMGWMFVPLVEYHGGGQAATLEPLSDHLNEYGRHLMQNFGAGVQACYRGPRLYDSPQTRAVVKNAVDFFKRHRAILESDIIHLRRPDGRDYDAILHVNPRLAEKALAMIYNPLDQAITRTIALPVYYAGLKRTATVRERDGAPRRVNVARDYSVSVTITIPAGGFTWLVAGE